MPKALPELAAGLGGGCINALPKVGTATTRFGSGIGGGCSSAGRGGGIAGARGVESSGTAFAFRAVAAISFGFACSGAATSESLASDLALTAAVPLSESLASACILTAAVPQPEPVAAAAAVAAARVLVTTAAVPLPKSSASASDLVATAAMPPERLMAVLANLPRP